MRKYRKKPVVIEAIQLTASNFDAVCDFMGETPEQQINPNFGVDKKGDTNEYYLGIYINTLEGKMYAINGDYIIKGVNGEFYPCKTDIFLKTYEPADIFKIGDVVILKSGGPRLTVTKRSNNSEASIICNWFAGDTLQQGIFHTDELIKAR